MTSMMDLYQKKYTILKRKCEELHQTNEKLVNRVYHVKKLLKRYKRERRMMVGELDRHGDDFRDVEIPPMYELPEEKPAAGEVQVKEEISQESSLLLKQENIDTMEVPEMVTVETKPDTSPSLGLPSTSRAVVQGR